MSSDKETHTQVVTPEQKPRLFPQNYNVLKYTAATARVVVHTTVEYDGPDTLVLCSTDGLGPPEDPFSEDPSASTCAYWKEAAISECGEDTPCTRNERYIECAFTVEANEGTLSDTGRLEAKETLSQKEYALFWCPTGDIEDERIEIFSYKAYDRVWSTGETASYAAHFLATKIAETSEVGLAGEERPTFDPDDPLRSDPDPPAFAWGGEEDDVEEVSGPYPEPIWASATPAKRRPVDTESGKKESKTLEKGTEKKAANGEQEKALTFEPPPGDRWVHLFRSREDLPVQGASVLGLYRVTEDETYKRARFDEEGSLSADGPEQSQLLVPLNSESLSEDEYTVYARLTPFRVSEDWMGRFLDADTPSHGAGQVWWTTVPLCLRGTNGSTPGLRSEGPWRPYAEVISKLSAVFDQFEEGVVTAEAPDDGASSNGTSDGEGTEAVEALREEPYLVLPHPLAVAERRLGVAEQARRRFTEWTEKMGGATVLGEMIHTTCAEEEHGRGYLSNRLKRKPETVELDPEGGAPGPFTPVDNQDGPETMEIGPIVEAYDMEAAWEGFSPSEDSGLDTVPSAPANDSLLSHFLYGAKQQRAYLRTEQKEAQQAVTRFIQSTLFTKALALDGLSSGVVGPVARRYVSVYARSVGIGVGEGVAQLVAESDLLDEMAHSANALAPLDEAASLPLAEAIGAPAFKTLYKFAQSSPELAQILIASIGPAVLSAATGTRTTFFRESDDLPATLAALRVHASWKPRNLQSETVVTIEEPTDTPQKRVLSVRSKSGAKQYAVRAVRTEVVEEADGTTRRGVQWTLDADGTVAEDLNTARRALTGASAGLVFGGAVLGAYGVLNNAQKGSFGPKEAVDSATVVTDLSSAFETTARYFRVEGGTVLKAAKVAQKIARAAPVLDAISGTMALYQQSTDVDTRGQAEVFDPNVVGAVGAGAMGLTGGLAVLGVVSGGTALVVGIVGSGAMWWSSWQDAVEQREADPVWHLLPDLTWGTPWPENVDYSTGSSFEKLFQLVKPGQDQKAPSLTEKEGPGVPSGAKPGQLTSGREGNRGRGTSRGSSRKGSNLLRTLRREGEAFTEKGFDFPVSVDVRETESGVVGLELDVALGYVAEFGTLMVDATVATQTDDPFSQTVGVRCAVHFVREGGDFRYRVVPAEATITLPSGDTTLSDWADEKDWAHSGEGDYQTPTGTEGRAQHIRARFGEWPVHKYSDVEQELAKYQEYGAEQMLDRQDEWPDQFREQHADVIEERRKEKEEAERIQEDTEANVDPRSVWVGPEGLGSVLESGRFEVTGSVYFSPLRPFQPDPEIPASGEAPRLIAEQEFEFRYP